MRYRHSVYGLTAELPFPCPALPPAVAGDAEVVCEFGDVPLSLEGATAAGPDWQATPRRFLYGAGSLSFLVEDGCRITLRSAADAERNQLLFLLQLVALPMALRQRGVVVLHAAVAAGDAGAIAIAGTSGTGKSTTLAGLIGRGWTMLADDVAVLRLSSDGAPEIVPAIGQLHLSEAAAHRLAWDTDGLLPRPWHRMKLAIPANGAMAAAPLPLRAVYTLDLGEGREVRATILRGSERFAALQQAVSGPSFAAEQAAAFPVLLAILARVPVIRVSRPAAHWSLARVLDIIGGGCGLPQGPGQRRCDGDDDVSAPDKTAGRAGGAGR